MLIRSKLSIAFGAIGVMVCGSGAIAVLFNSAVESDVAQVVHGSVEKPSAAQEMSDSLLNTLLHWQQAQAQMGPVSVEKSLGRNMAELAAYDLEQFEQYLAKCHDVSSRGVKLAIEEDNSEEIVAAKHEVGLLEEIRDKFVEMKELLQRPLDGTDTNSEASAAALLPAWKSQYEAISALVRTYKSGAQSQLNNEVREVGEALRRANQIMLWSTLIILVVAGVLAWVISRAFARPLNLLSIAAQRIGEGQLDAAVTFDSNDEFGLLARAFNRMTGDLRATTVSKDYLDGILKSMVSSLIVLRSDWTIESVNDSTLKLLGYTESELIGQSLEHILQTTGASLQSILDDAVQHGLLDVEFVYKTKAGQSVPVSFSASVLRSAPGVVTGLVCVAQDITERKLSEAALEKAHKEVVEASRHAGMAEVASGVLHNVGNVLNSVNVASTCLADSLKKSRSANLSKVVALLRANESNLGGFLTDDPKGKQILGYLTQLSEYMPAEQAAALKELAGLQKNIEHIKEIVTMQQSSAKASGVTECLSMAHLVEDALIMNATILARHDVVITKEFQEVPVITVEKHKVLQILVNLVRNATQACDESDAPEKRLTLRVTRGDNRVRVAVTDNGIGIQSENLTRIFAYGFTTKKSGHGFGLHSSALAAKEIGGSLTVHSDGVGHGATFTLELPFTRNGDSYEQSARQDDKLVMP